MEFTDIQKKYLIKFADNFGNFSENFTLKFGEKLRTFEIKIANCYWMIRILSHNIPDPLRPPIHLSYFAFWGDFASVFVIHNTKYKTLTIYFSHFIQIFKEILTFCAYVNPGTKWCKMWNAKKRGGKCEKSDTKYSAIRFLFCISRTFSHISR